MKTALINFRKVPLPKGSLEVYRCGFIKPCNNEWLDSLQRECDVQLILDLNGTQTSICTISGRNNITLVEQKMQGPNISYLNAAEVDYHNAYRQMLRVNMPVIGDVFRYFANGGSTILVSCLFGKDRTGLIIALLERLLNLNSTLIRNDYYSSLAFYLESGDLLHEHWEKRGISRERYMQRFHINPDIILNVLDFVIDYFGSLEQYLLECGLQAEEIARLKNKFYLG